MFDFSNYSTKTKYYDNLNTLAIGIMEDETASVAITKFVGLKLKIHSFLVGNNECKKAEGRNRNVVATTNHNENKDFLLNSKC